MFTLSIRNRLNSLLNQYTSTGHFPNIAFDGGGGEILQLEGPPASEDSTVRFIDCFACRSLKHSASRCIY